MPAQRKKGSPRKKSSPRKSGYYQESALYFDNNGTTFASRPVMEAMCRAMRLGNASTDYAVEAKKIIQQFTNKVKSRIKNKNVEVIVTSGASEANNLFLRSMAEIYPQSHFIVSAIEHGTSLTCAQRLAELKEIKLSLVQPRADGCIHLADIKKLVRKDTRVISVMHINNETGSMNDIESIGRFCRRQKIIYHADTVQSFGKYLLPAPIDAYSVSFHKMYGPQGIGCLVLDKHVLHLGFKAQIAGTQNHGLRGGTENLPGIAGALKAMDLTFRDRVKKNAQLKKKQQRILNCLRKYFQEEDFQDYYKKSDHFRGYSHGWSFMQVGGLQPNGKPGAPNVLLLSFVKNKADPHHFCNVQAKKCLLQKHCLVSIGSACHTRTQGASHVLKAMKAPFIVRCGVIRISLSDQTTLRECDELCRDLRECLLEQNL